MSNSSIEYKDIIIENDENEILKDKNRTLKIENENLKKENMLFKNENENLKKKNEDLQKQLERINLIKNEEINKLNEKFRILNEDKINTIANLMTKLKNNTAVFKNYNGLPDGEKLIAINFTSVDQLVNHCIICKNTTKFFELESDLYRKYPKYSENENCFTFNNLKINRWKTLEENGISSYTIRINKIDDK